MLLRISISLLLLPFIAGQATWSSSSSVDDSTIAAIRNILHLPLTQIQHALESLNQMREELASLASKVADLSATGCPRDCTHLFTDCSQLYQAGHRESGVYVMHILDGGQTIPINISCDMETDGGGWLVFQRRQDGSVDFYRDWISYTEGFGNITGEFWLGNKLLHQLTDRKPQQLRIDLHDHEGHTAYAKYGNFYVGPEMTKFTLNISGYSGTAGDGMAYNNNRMFSTKDQDNDNNRYICGILYKGAWWYGGCTLANLNGLYAQTGSHNMSGYDHVTWYYWRGSNSLKFTEMKIRPQDF